ncbi:MAG: 50S ribosome-binding GTPase, partial [Planctomycetes bacterium]|nr:50S ribosome-binding GTPase [Planctomycetota bacterium]
MFDRIEDTIVAVSSPPGSGVRGIIRLSGPRAFGLAATVFVARDGLDLNQVGGPRRLPGLVQLDEDAALPAEAYTFRSPASYTRQDLVELHTSGSPSVLAILLDKLTASGARIAEPGEFTGRAYLSGAIDLTRVEGVAAMIHAQTDAQLRASEALLHGALGRHTREMREELADLLALIEAGIDFAEEPIEFVSPGRTRETVDRIASRLDELLRTSASAERLDLLPRVVLAGRPNAGKSTLFNRLTGMDRAIQSATAGTTRDVIAAPINLPGGEVMLCDTAGVFDARPAETSDPTLQERIDVATAGAIATADLVLLVIDALRHPADAFSAMSRRLEGRRFAVVLNKIDELCREGAGDVEAILPGVPVLDAVSARTGERVDHLQARMAELLFSDTDKRGSALLSLTHRQRESLMDALDALRRAREWCGVHERADDHA